MTSPISPAFTPKEWADFFAMDGPALMRAQCPSSEELAQGIASANAARSDDDPGKLTRRLVVLLRAAAQACRGDDHHFASALDETEWSKGREERLASEYERAADIVAAVLPPEGT